MNTDGNMIVQAPGSHANIFAHLVHAWVSMHAHTYMMLYMMLCSVTILLNLFIAYTTTHVVLILHVLLSLFCAYIDI